MACEDLHTSCRLQSPILCLREGAASVSETTSIPGLLRSLPRARQPRVPASVPWSFRQLSALSVSPAMAGVGLATGLLGVFFAGEWASGRLAAVWAGAEPATLGCAHLLGDYRVAVIGSVAFAYAVVARIYLAGFTWTHLDRLRGTHNGRPDSLAPRRAVDGSALVAGALGVAATLLAAWDVSDTQPALTSTYWIWPHVFEWAWFLPFGWIAGQFLYEVLADARRVSRAAASLPSIDLFDDRWARPVLRQGQQSALLVVGLMAVLAVHFADSGTGAVVASVFAALFVGAAAIAMIPSFGARRRIREEKEALLERIRHEIAGYGQQLLGGPASDDRSGRIPDLVAMEERVRSVNEWPAIGGAGRIAVYATLGLLSWAGAAAVEQLLESMLG